jgi:hypothetical protein
MLRTGYSSGTSVYTSIPREANLAIGKRESIVVVCRFGVGRAAGSLPAIPAESAPTNSNPQRADPRQRADRRPISAWQVRPGDWLAALELPATQTLGSVEGRVRAADQRLGNTLEIDRRERRRHLGLVARACRERARAEAAADGDLGVGARANGCGARGTISSLIGFAQRHPVTVRLEHRVQVVDRSPVVAQLRAADLADVGHVVTRSGGRGQASRPRCRPGTGRPATPLPLQRAAHGEAER